MKDNKRIIFLGCRIFLNPGVVFLLLFFGVGFFIVMHKSGSKVDGKKSFDTKSFGLPVPINNFSSVSQIEDHNTITPKIQFEDVTLAAGIEIYHTQGGEMLNAVPDVVGSGACMADYDNDGFLDIYAINGSGYTHYYGKKWWWYKKPYNTLLHNNGDGTFTDVTVQAGVGGFGWGMGCAFGDYDNDGNPDLYVTNYGTNILYHNNGDGTFTDVTQKAGVGDKGWGTSLAWGDYDNNGYLDLYIANYLEFDKSMNPGESNSAFKSEQPLLMNSRLYDGQRNVLYKNNGDGTFTDVTNEAEVGNLPGRSLGVVFCDFNDDGFPDIYVVNDKSRNVLYRNNGTGTFTDVGGITGVDSPLNGMGVTAGDYDNDGDFDIFSTYSQADTNILYMNAGIHEVEQGKVYAHPFNRFVDATVIAGLGEDVSVGFFGWGTEFLDYDNDGYLDIFVANGHGMPDYDNPRSTIGQRNQIFRNNGDGTFLEVSGSTGNGLRSYNTSRGMAIGDYDNDGDTDIFIVNNNSYATLLQNVGGNARNWLTLKLIGTQSNRDAIGAEIKVVAGKLFQMKEVRSGSGYLSQSDMRVHFGLGNISKADTVTIRWPSGNVETFRNIKANQFIEIIEAQGSITFVENTKKSNWKKITDSENSEIDRGADTNTEVKCQVIMTLGEIGDESAIKPLLHFLTDNDALVRMAVIHALRYFNHDRTIEPLIMALNDSDAGVRREASASLCYLMKGEQTIHKASIQKKRLAVSPLIKALDDEDARVKLEVIRALSFSESYRACIPVTAMLRDSHKEVRKEAIITLGMLRDRRAIGSLINVLQDSDEDPSIRSDAIIALNRLGSEILLDPIIECLTNSDSIIKQKALSVIIALLENTEGVVVKKDQVEKYLTKAMKDENPEVRRKVVMAFGLIKDTRESEYIIHALGDKDDRVKQIAVRSLISIGMEEAFSYLVNSLQDKNYIVRKEAVMALEAFHDYRAIPCLLNMVNDTHNEVKSQAIMSLGYFREEMIIDVLLKILKNENEDLSMRLNALSSLNKIRGDKELLINLLDDNSRDIRRLATRYLGRIKDKRVINSLINSVTDIDREVRREAVLSLGSFHTNEVFESLVNVLMDKDEDDRVRTGAILSLSKTGSRKELFPMLKVLKDREDNVRIEVVKALEKLKDESVFKQLVMIIKNKNEDTVIRTEAIKTISQIDRENALEILLDLIGPFRINL